MHHFMRFPCLTFLLPIATIPWIGSFILKRLGIIEFLKFMTMIPLLYVGNYFWAAGFFKELLKKIIYTEIIDMGYV